MYVTVQIGKINFEAKGGGNGQGAELPEIIW